MKRWLFVLLVAVACAPGFVSAQDTAYKALRAVGSQRGEKALSQVTAIVGQSGRPQPVAWRVTLDDPAARGGARELDIVSGQVSSERTPVRSPAAGLAPIDLTKLNLDSDGAFRTAETEASRNQVGFDNVNYRLSVDRASGQPVWMVEMFDYEQRPVGFVRIAAGNGTLLSAGNWVSEGRVARGQQARPHSDAEALAGPPPPPVSGDGNPPADYRQPEYQDRNDASSEGDSDNHTGETVVERANHYGSSGRPASVRPSFTGPPGCFKLSADGSRKNSLAIIRSIRNMVRAMTTTSRNLPKIPTAAPFNPLIRTISRLILSRQNRK